MKTSLPPALAVVLGFIVAGMSAARAAGEGPSPGPVASNPPSLSSAALMKKAYLALVKESIVPADPRVVATAALAAIATLTPGRAVSLPDSFGTDAERDADWLGARVADLPPPWSVLDAMGRAAKTEHMGLGTPQRRQGLRARGAGHPLSAPGFNFLPTTDGRFVVFDLVKGASAELSGLRPGDVLVRIDGRRVMAVDRFHLHLLPAGAKVTLDIERAGHPATIVLQLVAVDVSPVVSRLLDGDIAYVALRSFVRSDDPGRDTAQLARAAFTSLAAQGARGLILDLRSALGGTGEVSIASALCDGDVVYSVRQPLAAPAQPVRREGARCWPDRPIVILVNELTVSAGEALALAAHELGHAKIVGRTSGGGLTEFSVVPLADGYGMTIPTGVVVGPVTGAVQPGHAVKPDIEVSNPSLDEFGGGRDRQLAAARAVLAGGPATP